MKSKMFDTTGSDEACETAESLDLARILDESFEMDGQCLPKSRLAYVARDIFALTTYDDSQEELIGREILDVCMAITNGTTFEFIEDEQKYSQYLRCVNMSFFKDRLDWGTSIRGAWWDHKGITLESYGLFDGQWQVQEIDFSREEWEQFMRTLAEFVAKDDQL